MRWHPRGIRQMKTKSIADQLSVTDERMMYLLRKLSDRMDTINEYPFESLMIVLADEDASRAEVVAAAVTLYRALERAKALRKKNEDNQG